VHLNNSTIGYSSTTYVTMQSPKSAKCEEHVGYANHCLILASATTDDETRTVLRKMAAEWLKLAEGALDNDGR
jgi:hypothetical protein